MCIRDRFRRRAGSARPGDAAGTGRTRRAGEPPGARRTAQSVAGAAGGLRRRGRTRSAPATFPHTPATAHHLARPDPPRRAGGNLSRPVGPGRRLHRPGLRVAPSAPVRAVRHADRPALRRTAADGGPRHGQAGRGGTQPVVGHRPDLRLPGGRRDRGGEAFAGQPGVLHPPGAEADQGAGCDHRRRLRLPRRHAPASLRLQRTAGLQLRRAGAVLPGPGARLGALRDDQGAGGRRRPAGRRATARHAAAVRLSALPGLFRHRGAAHHEATDPAGGPAQGDVGKHQAGRRRYPRGGVHRPGLPVDPWRARPELAATAAAEGAGDPGGAGLPAAGGGRGAARRLRVPALRRACHPGAGRPADANAAQRRIRPHPRGLHHGLRQLGRIPRAPEPLAGAHRLALPPGDRRPGRGRKRRGGLRQRRRRVDPAVGGGAGRGVGQPATGRRRLRRCRGGLEASQRSAPRPPGTSDAASRPGAPGCLRSAPAGDDRGKPPAGPGAGAGPAAGGSGGAAFRLPGVADREPRRAGAPADPLRGQPDGCRADRAVPDPARRAAQRGAPVPSSTGRRAGRRAARTADADSRGRPRAADGDPSSLQAGPRAAGGGLGDRRHAAVDEGQRLPDLAGRGDPRRGPRTGLAAVGAASWPAVARRRHAVRSGLRHRRLRQGRRAGVRPWLGPRPGVHP
ncbi:hypothetical protein PAERUG_E16_London_17_VIM_2_04_14_06048 [Pseudomonas aeruginosa]|nr:hypothetical protein PAERUG_E16_London_17_VIM_2_04_14_06048 [Pseudomonas aeruginosa]